MQKVPGSSGTLRNLVPYEFPGPFLFSAIAQCCDLWDNTFLMDVNIWILILLGCILIVQLFLYIPLIRLRKSRPGVQEESLQDPQTGLMNLDRFKRILEEELRRGGRYHYPVTLCHMDLEDFQDQTMRRFCQILKGTSRATDGAARFHKNEFCVLLPHTDMAHAKKFLLRLQKEAEEKLDLGFSAGVTSFQAGENTAQWLTRARTALVQAKGEGRRKIHAVPNEISAAINL